MVPESVDEFRRVRVPGVAWPVYRAGTGPPVVLLHELMGLTESVVDCARRLVRGGFTVYLPVLAGPTKAKGAGKLQAMAGICVSSEIHALRSGRTSPAVAPLRLVAQYAARAAGTERAGVVGMCFTGGFALAAACDPVVAAGVAAQPSLPFRLFGCGRDLGMSDDDIGALCDRLAAGDTEIWFTRFTGDRMSPPRRARELAQRLGTTGVTVDELDSSPGNPYGFRKKAHSVLAAERHHPDHKDVAAAQERLDEALAGVVAFLHRRLD